MRFHTAEAPKIKKAVIDQDETCFKIEVEPGKRAEAIRAIRNSLERAGFTVILK